MSLARVKFLLKRRWMQSRAARATRRAFRHDVGRYLRHSSTLTPFATRENLRAKITERYHNIEKGLSLPEPRPGFGHRAVATLISLVDTYLEQYGEDETTQSAIGALAAYDRFNLEHGQGEAAPFHRDIATLTADRLHHPAGTSGTRTMTAADVRSITTSVHEDFFTSRHSTRIYAPTPVRPDDVAFAVRAAQSAPAVCNRQFGRIQVWQDRETIDRLLEIQGGARGFGHAVPGLALVTVSLRSYWGPGERNQMWIDGGLFAMNFMLGLHARGLGSVPLNWSKEPQRDTVLRQELPSLEASESVIMFVAFGNLADQYRVAASPRTSMRG